MMTGIGKRLPLVATGLLGAAMTALTGCQGLAPTTPSVVSGTALHGTVYGGQNPVSGSTIQLYAAGSTGYGSANPYATGSSLLGNHVVTSASDGTFNITGDYTCPSAATPVYLVATQGNPGLPSGYNANLALMAALGPCGNLTSSSSVFINELTTVASVWALSPFMTGIANVGTSATNATGLTNAFASVSKLVNIGAGTIPGAALPAGAVYPGAKMNTLADILAACVNSGGGVAGDGSVCGNLFTYTTVNGVAPTDTITAALNIAQHPNVQTANLTALTPSAAPFQPTLTGAPKDFSLVLTYSGVTVTTTKAIAVDASGSVWLPNPNGNAVTKLSNTGAVLFVATNSPLGTFNLPATVAIDTSGNAWVMNSGGNTVVELTSAGSLLTYYNSALSAPNAAAFDASGNIWIANSGNGSVTEITNAGALSNYAGPGIAAPTAIAINPK
jgi:hypothetical protein